MFYYQGYELAEEYRYSYLEEEGSNGFDGGKDYKVWFFSC